MNTFCNEQNESFHLENEHDNKSNQESKVNSKVQLNNLKKIKKYFDEIKNNLNICFFFIKKIN